MLYTEVNNRFVYTGKSEVHQNFFVAVTGNLTDRQKRTLHATVASLVKTFNEQPKEK